MAQLAKMILRRAPTIISIALLLGIGPVTRASAAQREQGILEIQIKDHREAIGDFAKLDITIEKLLVSPKPGLKIWHTGWTEIGSTSTPVGLTQYVGKTTARIFRGTIDVGSFDAFHLKIKKIDGLLKKKKRSVPVKDKTGPIKLSFDVKPQGETILILDFIVSDMSDHPPLGYELGVRGLELFTNGKLVEKIPPG